MGKTGDGGIDGVIDEDHLGLDRIYVQSKRYAPHVGVGRPEVQGFVGSLVGFGATKGVFVTTSSFSAPAMDFVRHLPQRIILIDDDRLADLMIEHGVGVRMVRTVEVKRLDENFFVEEKQCLRHTTNLCGNNFRISGLSKPALKGVPAKWHNIGTARVSSSSKDAIFRRCRDQY